MFKIYQITSPSGKHYIGITKQKIEKRWRAHVYRSTKGNNHPFLNAIKKYGKDTFVIKELASVNTIEEAKTAEVFFISFFETTDRSKGYNVSKGGDYDAEAGGKVFWERMNSNPEEKKLYIERLKLGIAASMPGRDFTSQKEGLARWREENPELAKEADIRLRNGYSKWMEENPDEVKKIKSEQGKKLREFFESHKDEIQIAITAGIRRSFQDPERIECHRLQVSKNWASYSEEKLEDISSKIAAKAVVRHAEMNDEERAANRKQLDDARLLIDHDKRKRNQKIGIQKIGIQKYWTPERRSQRSIDQKAKIAAGIVSPPPPNRKKVCASC